MAQIDYRWIPVEVEKGIPLLYPSGASKYLKEHYSNASVYRWGFFKSGAILKAYIGEAWNLAERIPQYLKPGPSQRTNIRIHHEMEADIKSAFEVRLDTLRVQEPFRLNSVLIADSEMHNPFVRLLIENFAIADHEKITCEILNLKRNPLARRQRKAVRSREQAGF